jgi:hypothetical protein
MNKPMSLSRYRRLIEDTRDWALAVEMRPTVARVKRLRVEAATLQSADCPEREPFDVQCAEVVMEYARKVLLREERKAELAGAK